MHKKAKNRSTLSLTLRKPWIFSSIFWSFQCMVVSLYSFPWICLRSVSIIDGGSFHRKAHSSNLWLHKPQTIQMPQKSICNSTLTGQNTNGACLRKDKYNRECECPMCPVLPPPYFIFLLSLFWEKKKEFLNIRTCRENKTMRMHIHHYPESIIL